MTVPRVGISVKRYTILKMSPKILHNTNFPKFEKWVRKSKNYRTKKKGHGTFENQSWVPKAKNYRTTKKKKRSCDFSKSKLGT